jgi:hypothetical protein
MSHLVAELGKESFVWLAIRPKVPAFVRNQPKPGVMAGVVHHVGAVQVAGVNENRNPRVMADVGPALTPEHGVQP